MAMLKRLLLILIVPLVVASCGGSAPEEEPKVKRAPRPKPKPAAEARADQADEKAPEISPDVKHRNPFLSYVVVRKGSQKDKKIRGPLERYPLEVFRVIAVVAGDSTRDSYALVQAPDNKRYIVRTGDVMGNKEGRIVGINTGGITVKEVNRNFAGEVTSTTEQVLKLPSKEK